MVIALERGSNRLTRWALRAGLAPRPFALLETTGRRTGLARHTPVGNGLCGDTFWLVAAHGTQADYVRNLQAEPRVRAWCWSGSGWSRWSRVVRLAGPWPGLGLNSVGSSAAGVRPASRLAAAAWKRATSP